MKFRLILINISIFIVLYLISDLIFSKFFFKQSVDHKCYEHLRDGNFYQMRKNCFSNMRLISSIDSFKVYTDNEGRRFSGKKTKLQDNTAVFLGDSQTFGVGSNWDDTFVGILEKKYKDYNFYNLAVPSYSPTVYQYKLKKFIEKNETKIKKIFVLIDLTDVGDEANRWEKFGEEVNLMNEKIFYKKNSGFSKFKKDNFKGLYLIASKIRSLSRKIESKNNTSNYRPVDGNPTGAYIYTDHQKLMGCDKDEKQSEFWKCGGIKMGLDKIESNVIEIGNIASKINSEFYIIIMPWPDSLNFGQTKFNWESFNYNLCILSGCKKLINLFPKFKEIKFNKKNWLEILYLNNDIHLTKFGNSLVAEEIIKNSFN